MKDELEELRRQDAALSSMRDKERKVYHSFLPLLVPLSNNMHVI